VSDPVEEGAIEPSTEADGGWFLRVLQRHTQTLVAEQGGLVAPWRAEHPDLDDLALARVIVRTSARKAALIGGASGAITPIAAWASAGTGLGGAAAIAVAELAALERLQLRMLLTLAELSGRPLDNDHINEIVTIYAHVLKVKGASRAATMGRQALVTLCRTIALRFMQRASVKLVLPIVAVGLGGGMNYLLTRGLGQHALSYFDLTMPAISQEDAEPAPALIEDKA
jgi:uncharacterized protein (DUF697 family)